MIIGFLLGVIVGIVVGAGGLAALIAYGWKGFKL